MKQKKTRSIFSNLQKTTIFVGEMNCFLNKNYMSDYEQLSACYQNVTI